MKTLKQLSETGKRVGERVLGALVAWAMAFAPTMAAAQGKAQPQKAAGASQSQSAPVTKASAEKEPGTPTRERSRGPQEGIRVHGHWVIEVRDPDGTLASRREFENALTGGKALISNVLIRRITPGTWAVSVGGGLCPLNGTTDCNLIESGSTTGGVGNPNPGNLFRSLMVDFGDGTQVTLKGSFTAANAGNVGSVATWIGYCSNDTTPNACISTFQATFSATAVNPAIAVQQGQIVQVSVTISFS